MSEYRTTEVGAPRRLRAIIYGHRAVRCGLMRMLQHLLLALLASHARGRRGQSWVDSTARYNRCISTQVRLLIVPSRHPEFNRARDIAQMLEQSGCVVQIL